MSGEQELANYASSASHKRVFCKTCGSNILVDLDSEPDALYVAMGTMEGNPDCPPGYHIYVGSKAAWHEITDELPQYEAEPEEN